MPTSYPVLNAAIHWATAIACLAVAIVCFRQFDSVATAYDLWKANPVGFAPSNGIGWALAGSGGALGAVVTGYLGYEQWGDR